MDAQAYIRASLLERGWSIPHFAKQAHVSIGLAYKWLSEDPAYRITPSPASCEKIAQAFGVDTDVLLELAGHRKPSTANPRADLDARQQAIRDQLDRWLIAVGPEHEEYFWQHLKAQGDSTVKLIQRLGTAVNEGAQAAVNAAVSRTAKRGRRRGDDPGSTLRARQHPSASLLTTSTLTLAAGAAA